MTEFPEEPRGASSSSSQPDGAPAATEAELWLRRELAFLHRVERRIRRRARWRQEAWRAVVVTAILSVFALCWYLAALATASPARGSCAGKTTAATAPARSGAVATGSGAARAGSDAAASCGS